MKKDIKEKLNVNIKFTDLNRKLEREISDADILINTTPVGMYPNINQSLPIKSDMLHKDLIVKDLVYNPLKTRLLIEAEKKGAKTISGFKMLIYQGMESFKIWTGVYPPMDVFENALKPYMG